MMAGDKRSYEEEPIADDLAVAAQYAMAKPLALVTSDDDNEIDLETAEDTEAKKVEIAKKTPSNEADESLDDSDYESDVDLKEQLEVMEKMDSAVEERPKTVNEIDGYKANAKELEAALNFSLSVEEYKRINVPISQLKVAGSLQNHMVDERTIVVKGTEGGTILDEGTLLTLTHEEKIVPLGKVFELFGPVSQPLYSIRLPEQLDDSGQPDPWAIDGELTKLIQSNPLAQVFYIPEAATTVDTRMVYRLSGKGCDASNLHDEEVVNPNEMYFSDDEEERKAKSSRRKGKGSATVLHHEAPILTSGRPTGFHATVQASSAPIEAPGTDDKPDTEYFDSD